MTGSTLIHWPELHRYEADLLHPQHWDGHTAGVGEMQGWQAPDIGLRVTAAMLKGIHARNQVLWRQQRGLLPVPVIHYRPGHAFNLASHARQTVLFDQSILLLRGKYSVDPNEFPSQPQGTMPAFVTPNPVYHELPRLRYIREPAVAVCSGDQQLLATTMGDRAPLLREYRYQVGVLALPEAIHVGNVTHFAMPDGQEMLARTHNIYVYPAVR